MKVDVCTDRTVYTLEINTTSPLYIERYSPLINVIMNYYESIYHTLSIQGIGELTDIWREPNGAKSSVPSCFNHPGSRNKPPGICILITTALLHFLNQVECSRSLGRGC